MRKLFYIVCLIVASCNNQPKQVEKKTDLVKSTKDFFPEDVFFAKEILFINAYFSECGEWGGHKEKMIVFTKSDREFYLCYQKFKVDCDSIGFYYGTEEFQKLELQDTIKLNQDNKNSISDYIQRMVKSKIEEEFPGHAGNIFSVLNSDSTLFIEVYDNKEYDVKSYKQLLTEMHLTSSK